MQENNKSLQMQIMRKKVLWRTKLIVLFLSLLYSNTEINYKRKNKKDDSPNLIAAKSYILNWVLTPTRLIINQNDQIKTTSKAEKNPSNFLLLIKFIFLCLSVIFIFQKNYIKDSIFKVMNKLENFKNVIIITWYILKTESSIVNGEYSPQKI